MIGTFVGCGDVWAPGIRIYRVEEFSLSAYETNNLYVDVNIGSVIVRNGEVTDIEIIMSNYVDAGGYTVGTEYMDANLHYTLTTNNGTIQLTHTQNSQVDGWNIIAVGSKIVITVPTGISFETQNIVSTVGSIDLNLSNRIDEMYLHTSTGSITADGLRVDNIRIQQETGSLDLFNVSADSIISSNQTGSSFFQNVYSPLFVHENSTGSVDFKGIRSENLTAKTSAGSIGTHRDYHINCGNLTLETTTGSIDAKVTNAVTMNVKTTTGSIDMKIYGFAEAGTSSLNADLGSVDLKVVEDATRNLKVYAKSSVGSVSSSIRFEHTIENNSLLDAYNGTGENFVNINVGTGSVTVKDF